MTDIIWIRHGMSYQNVETALDYMPANDWRTRQMKEALKKIPSAVKYSELTPEGYEQAERVGKHLAYHWYKVGRLCCSWMPRAILTAYTISRQRQPPYPKIFILPFIQETNNPAPSKDEVRRNLKRLRMNEEDFVVDFYTATKGSVHDMSRFRREVLPNVRTADPLVIVSHGNLLARYVEPVGWANTTARLQRVLPDGRVLPATPVYTNYEPIVDNVATLYASHW